MPPVEKAFERVGIDLTDMVAGDLNYRYVLSVIDHYSRYVKFFPLKHKHTHTHTHTHCGRGSGPYVADFGAPQALAADNGGEFRFQQFPTFCQRLNIQVHYTTPYSPRGNGITERMHRPMPRTSLSWSWTIAECIVQESMGVMWARHIPETGRCLWGVSKRDQTSSVA